METYSDTGIGEDYYEGSSDYPEPAEFQDGELDEWRGCSWDDPEQVAA